MNVYKIRKSYSDNYKNHQMVKEIFPGFGKLLFQKQGSILYVLTDLEINNKFIDDFRIEKLGDSLKGIKIDISKNFSIRLNAVKTNKRKRYAICSEKLEEFVDNKLSNMGAEINNRIIMNEGIFISDQKGNKCSHSSVLVVGILTVKNIKKFSEVIHSGIGKAKGFGFGMINIFQ